MIASHRNATDARVGAVSDQGPSEIEALLPWHAIGRLAPKDARRVEDALHHDPVLARQFRVIQDEAAETVHLNESLGAPSTRAMRSLMNAIDAEPARSGSKSRLWTSLTMFVASLSPRALTLSAATAAALVLVQAGVIGALLVKQPAGNYQTASYGSPSVQGSYALVRFSPDAKLSDITAFLDSYNASIVSGPKAGMFRVQFGDKSLSKEDAARLLARIQNEPIVGFAAAAD